MFVSEDNSELLVADVLAGDEFTAGASRVVGHLPKGVSSLDATADLRRILALVNESSNAGPSITVVQNWSLGARWFWATVENRGSFPSMAVHIGTRLGPDNILSPLGAGGFGEVYKARDIRLDRV
jgi:hypothetical protein